MIAIVKSRNNQALLQLATLFHRSQELVSDGLHVLVGPGSTVDVEQHRRVGGLLLGQLLDAVQIDLKSGNVDRRLAGSRRAIWEREMAVRRRHDERSSYQSIANMNGFLSRRGFGTCRLVPSPDINPLFCRFSALSAFRVKPRLHRISLQLRDH